MAWEDLDVPALFAELSVWEAPRREVGGYRYGRCWHLSDADRAAVLRSNRAHRDPTEHEASFAKVRAARKQERKQRPRYTVARPRRACHSTNVTGREAHGR